MKNPTIKVAPSILSADFSCLGDEARRIEDAGADAIHIDIMDGHFVPNLTMGPQVVAAINRSTDLFLDVHLMMYNPFAYIERFIEAGADSVTIHFEATEDVEETLGYIRRCNVKAGLAFCPETSAEFAEKYISHCDLMLMMTVQPGFGGQAFMPEVLPKIEAVRKMCAQQRIGAGGKVLPEGKDSPLFDIQVDGGINAQTAADCVAAGATLLVAGTSLFQEENMAEAIQGLKEKCC